MERKDDLLFEGAGTQQTKVKISEIESMLIKKKLHTIDFEKQSKAIEEQCQKIGLNPLMSHPYILALWSRAKYAQGKYYESLRLSRLVCSLADEQEQRELLCDEWILQAQSFLALSDINEAESALRKGANLTRGDSRQLHLVEFLRLRLLIARGDFETALARIARLREGVENLAQDMRLRSFKFLLSPLCPRNEKVSEDCLSDVECFDPDRLDLPIVVMQEYCFARLMLAHNLALRGDFTRARDLLTKNNQIPQWLVPHYKTIEVEIDLLSGNFEKAFINSDIKMLGTAHGLCRTELVLYSWTRLLALLGYGSLDLFGMQALRLKNAIEGTQSPFLKIRTLLFASLGCCLTHDYEQAKLMYYPIKNDPLIEKNANNRLLSFLVQAIIAYRAESLDNFMLGWFDNHPLPLIDENNYLYAFVCLHAHPLMGELILKAQQGRGSLHKILYHARAEIVFDRVHLGLLEESDWSAAQRLFDDLHSEATGKPLGKAPFRVSVLGALSISYRGQKISLSGWHRGKTRELFCSLVLQAGHELSRDEVIERLWPGRDFNQARNSYYVAWSSMKHYLTDIDKNFRMLVPPYSSGSHGYIDSAICSVDILDFERHIMDARHAQQKGENDTALHHYAQAETLYRGDLLPGDLHTEWLIQPREYYHSLYIEGMIAAAEICLDVQQPQRAIEFIESALHQDSSREKLYEIAMRSYAQASRREDAIHTFLACKKYLNEEFGLDPSASLQKFYISLISE